MGFRVTSSVFSIRCQPDATPFCEECYLATHFWDRCRGLLGFQGPLPVGFGLWIRPCSSIHLWGMKTAIDAVFIQVSKGDSISSDYHITSVWENLPPWKVFPVSDWRAQSVLELPVGTVARHYLKKGDPLWIKPIN